MPINLFNSYSAKTELTNKKIAFTVASSEQDAMSRLIGNFNSIDNMISCGQGSHDTVGEIYAPGVIKAMYDLGNLTCRQLAIKLNSGRNGFSNYERINFDKLV